MFNQMLIRKKILYSTVLLTATLLLLMYCSLRGVYAYRNLTINIGKLSAELTLQESLRREFDDLKHMLVSPPSRGLSIEPPAKPTFTEYDLQIYKNQLEKVVAQVEELSARINEQESSSDPLLATSQKELKCIENVRTGLNEVERSVSTLSTLYTLSATDFSMLDENLTGLAFNIQELFDLLTGRMNTLRDETRVRYRSWIVVITFSAFASLFNVGITFWFFRQGIVKPFKLLLSGSRSIAKGRFDHRIRLQSQDELAELADAMNGMTNRFVEIRNNLNDQVQQRTKEVVRSEQLASVGFLAAGVAHEINNPLASIAWSAEALESRLHEVLHPCQLSSQSGAQPHLEFDAEQIEILRDYLKRIQDEAFRCKGITERLLDFSRLGESHRKQETDIQAAVSDVCELVKHLGQYRNRQLHFKGTPGIFAWVSPTEFKQVVLNLLTNALDATEEGGHIHVQLEAQGNSFVLRVKDNGCGMTEDVIEHLFEPFFTRRRDGRGTGLGLSISYQIVQDHRGKLVASSPGPDAGSTMELTIPIYQVNEEKHERLAAA